MKIFHIESGLGNQMLDYTDLLASRLKNPDEEFFIETILFELGEVQNRISMWNGYELEKIFGIKEKNVKSLFSQKQWESIIDDIVASKFWDKGWAYSNAIVEAFSRQGLYLNDKNPHLPKENILQHPQISRSKYYIKNLYYKIFEDAALLDSLKKEELFLKSDTDDFNGHFLRFMYKGAGIENIHEQIIEKFRFPEYDKKNNDFSVNLKHCNSVAIHARRGDFLGQNAYCYKYGYFKRAVNFIKKVVPDPVFVVFCDTDSIQWCKENYNIFSLDFSKDKVLFVDWNKNQNSFRDMQLMADCKHNIVTNSSFGWWGAYLNDNKNKITFSPDAKINTTHWI